MRRGEIITEPHSDAGQIYTAFKRNNKEKELFVLNEHQHESRMKLTAPNFPSFTASLMMLLVRRKG